MNKNKLKIYDPTSKVCMCHFVERMIVPYDLIAKIDSCFTINLYIKRNLKIFCWLFLFSTFHLMQIGSALISTLKKSREGEVLFGRDKQVNKTRKKKETG